MARSVVGVGHVDHSALAGVAQRFRKVVGQSVVDDAALFAGADQACRSVVAEGRHVFEQLHTSRVGNLLQEAMFHSDHQVAGDLMID